MNLETSPELEPRIQKHFSLLRIITPRDPQRAAQTRQAFMAQVRSMGATVSKGQNRRHSNWMGLIIPIQWRKEPMTLMKPLLALFVSMTLVLSSIGAMNAAAQSSLPDEPLYGIKTLAEDVQLALIQQTQTRLELVQQLVNRRVDEIIALHNNGVNTPAGAVARLETHLNEQLRLAASQDDPAMQQTLAQVRTQTQTQEQRMARLSDTADPLMEQARIRLQEQVRLAEGGMQDPQGFREQVQNLIQNRYQEHMGEPTGSPEGGKPVHTETPGQGDKKPSDTPGGNGQGPQPSSQPQTPQGTSSGPNGPNGTPQGTSSGPNGPNGTPQGTSSGPEGPKATPQGTSSGPESPKATPQGTSTGPGGPDDKGAGHP